MTEPLVHHSAEHGCETVFVGICVLPHFLEGGADAHLAGGDGYYCV